MANFTRKKKLSYAIGLFFLGLMVLLAALPLWFPWVLQPVLKNYGVAYSRYERAGYSRLVLHEIKFSDSKKQFTAHRIETFVPTVFLWRNFRHDQTTNYLHVSSWTLDFFGHEKKAKTEPASVFSVSEKLDPVLEQLNRWLPKATLDDGVIRFGKKQLSVAKAEWNEGKLSGQMSSEKLFPETFFTAQFGRQLPTQITVKTPAWNFAVECVARPDEEILKVEGGAIWQSNRVEITAQFGREDLYPRNASLQSKFFQIPAHVLKLEGYGDLTGSVEVRWQTNRFEVDLTAKAQPLLQGKTFLSPVEAVVRASGDTNSVRLETVNISSPWLQANLSKNIEFNFRGEMLSEAATLEVAGDLSHQNWVGAKGQFNGEAVLRRGQNRFPDTTFNLSGTNVSVGKIETQQSDVHGNFEWPWLRMDVVRVQFKDGGMAEANLNYNAVTRTITNGSVKLGGNFGTNFLPGISYQNVALTVEISGPLKNLSHTAHLEIQEAKLPNLAPLGIVGDWRGTQLEFENLRLKISAKNSTLAVEGALNVETNLITAKVQTFVFTTNGQRVLNLEKPFAVSSTGGNPNRTLSVDTFSLRGERTELALGANVQWPNRGTVSVTTTQLNFSTFGDFAAAPVPSVLLERMNLFANWTNGPVHFSANVLARFTSEDGTPFSAEAQTTGDEKGISIVRADVGSAAETVISGKGFLPITLEPGNRSNLVQILPEQKIDFHAATTPNAQLWERITKWTHATMQEPAASIRISGTLDAPEGKVLLSAKEIALKPTQPDQPIPRLQNFLADFDLVRDRIALHRFEVLVEGQPVTATGELPLPKNFGTNWNTIFDWRKADGHLKIVDAQIAPFQRLFPKFLSPLGTVNLDVMAAKGKLDGELRVAGGALRPIPSLGPVHDIDAIIQLHGDDVKLETFKGSIGGQPIDLTGEIHLPKDGKFTELPRFNFILHGTNVPLARSSDLILRSDIDLNFSNEKGGEPLVSGELNLRDSFFLSDLRRFIPGKVAKPKQRPPYFSVETEPFAHWRISIGVSGDNVFKVRSPLFRGELSVSLRIEGTLREPVAIGDARLGSGMVQLPFANLRIDQGYISLTSENPYRPQLSISASARTFGYDVKMDISGPADKPNVEFSSTPGLTSEQILLMVTAGELPRDEINFSTQQKAGQLAFFLGKNLFSKFGSNSATEDKLEIRSGEDISEQGRQTYYLEYRLTDDWSIVGEYDRFGGVNAGVKWKFFSK